MRGEVLSGVMTNTVDMGDRIALTTVYPGEQIISGKFGSPSEQEVLSIPDDKMAISVNLTDPARVAGFVNPGAEVAVFVSAQPLAEGDQPAAPPPFTRLLLPRVQVIGVGTTTVVSTTTTAETGEQTTEELPRTLLTLAVDQDEAESVLFAAKNGEVAFALLTEKSKVVPGLEVTAKNIFR
jgi:pilus assembly protein CpaB